MSFRHSRCRHSTLVGLTLAAVGSAAPVLAVDKTWNAQSGNWSEVGKWTPNGVPAAGDHARIGNQPGILDPLVELNQNVTIAALSLTQFSDLDTSGRRLTVSGQTLIDGASNSSDPSAYARLTVDNNAVAVDFSTGSLILQSAGALRLVGSTTEVDTTFSMLTDSWLGGSGSVLVGDDAALGGVVSVFNGSMLISVANGASVDLDGAAGNGEIIINDAGSNLTISAGGISDNFDGYLFVGPDSDFTLNVPGSWTLGSGALLQSGSWASSGNVSRVLGAPLNVAGRVVVQEGIPDPTDNTLRFVVPVTFQPTADVETNSSELILDNVATINGGVFDVGPDGRVTFAAAATVNGGTFAIGDDGKIDFNAATALNGGQFATVSSSSGDGVVNLNGPTTYSGTIGLLGAARQGGNASVPALTTVNANAFDMDGAGDTAWNISNILTINADRIDATPGNIFDGTINLGGSLFARLVLNLSNPSDSMTINGVMNLTGDAALFPLRLAGAPLRFIGDLNVLGGRSRVDSHVTFDDAGTVTFGNASAVIRMHGQTRIEPLASFNGDGTMETAASGVVTFDDGASIGGVRLVNAGRLVIANGPGIASVDRFENGAGGVWEVEIGGHIAGGEHDALIVSGGAAQLAGTLEVDVVSGFEPQVGDEFVILTAVGGVNGTFTANPAVACAAGVRYQWSVLYGPNSVNLRLDAILPDYPGDLNCDCRVDFFDIDVLVEALSYPGGAGWPHDCPWLNGDCDGDGDVDFFDIDPFVALIGS